MGNEVRDSIDVFDDSVDHDPYGLACDLVVRVPYLREDNHVEQTRLVFEVQESNAASRRRSLAVGDDPANASTGAVSAVFEDRYDREASPPAQRAAHQ